MTNTITLTDEQVEALRQGRSVNPGIVIHPPHQTPCQQRGLREGQWVWIDTGEHGLEHGQPSYCGWAEYAGGTTIPCAGRRDEFRTSRCTSLCVLGDKYIDWSRGIHDEKPVEKWEPKGGGWTCLVPDGSAERHPSMERFAAAGLERDREDHAERAAKELRQYARLLAWRDERCPDYVEPAMSVAVSSVRWNWQAREWEAFIVSDRGLLAVTMPEKAAQQLAHDLNTGKVEL